MAQLMADCPRCGVKRTSFDIRGVSIIEKQKGWQEKAEFFCICRSCNVSTVFLVFQKEAGYGLEAFLSRDGFLNDNVIIDKFISLKDINVVKPPEHLPEEIEEVFNEGAACMSIECFNASATMFRLCLDLATKDIIAKKNITSITGRDKNLLALRLKWLIDNNYISESLRDLSLCVKDNGNDGAHEGVVSKEDALDIQDFTGIFLERLYTEPKRIELAKQRSDSRRNKNT